jgi:hypothetical protein
LFRWGGSRGPAGMSLYSYIEVPSPDPARRSPICRSSNRRAVPGGMAEFLSRPGWLHIRPTTFPKQDPTRKVRALTTSGGMASESQYTYHAAQCGITPRKSSGRRKHRSPSATTMPPARTIPRSSASRTLSAASLQRRGSVSKPTTGRPDAARGPSNPRVPLPSPRTAAEGQHRNRLLMILMRRLALEGRNVPSMPLVMPTLLGRCFEDLKTLKASGGASTGVGVSLAKLPPLIATLRLGVKLCAVRCIRLAAFDRSLS